MVALRSAVLVLALACLGFGCAGLPGAVKPPDARQAYAPVRSRTAAVVQARLCGRDAVALPDGWRLPGTDEVSDDWRQDDPARFLLVDADLDGDGRLDQARLLMRVDGSEFGMFAFLCRADGEIEPHLVLHNRELVYFKLVGIRAAAPGVYPTACGRGTIDCYAGEPREVRLGHGGIDYFKNESVTSLFYWSDDVQAFKWVAINKSTGRTMAATR